MSFDFLGKPVSGEFTIPSGIVTTDIKVVERIANEIPEIGVITTKSIGLEPRDGNREPIITQYAPGCFMNAVGLTNPGAKAFSEQLKNLKIPKDKFVLTSIFGQNADEFVEVAKILAPYSDGLELNLSCPHAKGYGMAIGQDADLVKEIVSAVKKAVKVPVVPKLTPNVPNIGEIAQAAVSGGADAICAINTVGPGYFAVEDNPVLTNKVGGMSGKGVLPIGLKCVKEIREAVDVPIISCGGISGGRDVQAYRKAGGNIFGVGSTLAGLSLENLKKYFKALQKDIKYDANEAENFLRKDIDMTFREYRIVESKILADDLSLIVFDKPIDLRSGQFVFAWIPDVGEKPFSVLDNNPLTLIIHKKGCFTKALIDLKKGAKVYFRGPYGNPVEVDKASKTVIVSGGCGLGALYQIAKDAKNADVFIGARDKDHLFYIDELKKIANVFISTNDGSVGEKGLITVLLEKELGNLKDKNIVFYNSGPRVMIDAVAEIEKRYAPSEKIMNSIDYITKCGIGICGSCATKEGKRMCVDGPFIKETA